MNVLLIGCGNIGALYDFDTGDTRTHCKALSKLSSVSVSIYDEDTFLAQKVSARYNFNCIKNIADIKLGNYDWVAIASPTNTHLAWLKKSFESKVPLVICEKPVAKNKDELSELEILYNSNNTRVVVNYFRRFHPAYSKIKESIQKRKKPVHISIRYQRGVINNFSHASDLLSYFFGLYSFEGLNITQRVSDEFDDDPTISFTASYNGIPVSVIGLANVTYSYFEADIFLEDGMISIANGGDKISFYEAAEYEKFYKPLVYSDADVDNLLSENMKHVYQHVQQVYKKEMPDNFLESLKMNQHILQLIQQ